jgi:hypothetical protein
MASEVGRPTLEYTREYMANPSKVPGPRVCELSSLAMAFCGFVYNDLRLIIIYFSFTLDDVRVTGSYTDLRTGSRKLPVCLF